MPPTWFVTTLLPWGLVFGIFLGIFINGMVMSWALRKRHLTRNAAVTAFVIGLSLWMIEPLFFIVLLIFFMSSSVLSKLRSHEKKEAQERVAKGSTRDVHQVLANGSAGFVAAIIYAIASATSPISLIPISATFSVIAAFAAPNSDTWSTEIGMLSATKPRWILDLRRVVEPGTSGGVTRKGTIAAAAGALLVASIGFLLSGTFGIASMIDQRYWFAFIIAASAAFLGSLVDSVVGATVQAVFRCQVCGKETEKRVHCSKPTSLVRGLKWLDNDAVNFISSAFAAASTFLVVLIVFLS